MTMQNDEQLPEFLKDEIRKVELSLFEFRDHQARIRRIAALLSQHVQVLELRAWRGGFRPFMVWPGGWA